MSIIFALQREEYGGFGFQVGEQRNCLYLAQVFQVNQEMLPDSAFAFEKDMPESALALLHPFVPRDKVWITDFLGREWITIDVAHFNDVPRIFNSLLDAGYRVLTHTPVKTEFKPGEEFSRRSFELHMIDSVRINYDMLDFMEEGGKRWDYLRRVLNLRSLLKHYNWATEEGHAFCAH